MFPSPHVDAMTPNSDPILTGLSWDALYNLQKEDKFIKAVACFLKFHQLPREPKFLSLIKKVSSSAVLENGVVLVNGKFFAPFSIRHTLLHAAHDDPMSGHAGPEKTFQLSGISQS